MSRASPTRALYLTLLLFPPLLATPAHSLWWPFSSSSDASVMSQRTEESWTLAGNLGLLDVSGKIVGLGDWDGDQFLDIFATNHDRTAIEIHKFNPNTGSYTKHLSLPLSSTSDPSSSSSSSSTRSTSSEPHLANLIPIDINHDGRIDLLAFVETTEEDDGDKGGWGWGKKSWKGLKGEVWLQDDQGGVGFTSSHPILFDSNGNLRPDLLGMAHVSGSSSGSGEENGKLMVWENSGDGRFERTSPRLEPAGKLCKLAEPHSNAFIDLDGDCLADLFLMCEAPYADKKSFQVWLNKKEEGFVWSGEWELPDGAGAVGFADMDRDGTIDLIFPTCTSHSSTSGIGRGCSINIAYNKQKPLCKKGDGGWFAGLGQAGVKVDGGMGKGCRDPGQLCVGDEGFGFDMSEGSDSFASISISSLFPGTTSILFTEPNFEGSPSSPYIPLSIGDFNVDGFPDILALVVNSTAAPTHGGIFGGGRGAGVQVKVLENVKGGKGVRRGLRGAEEVGLGGMDDIWDARGATWLDVGEDGMLDILIERSGKQDQGKVAFVKNNVFRDAFFLKAMVLNGACEGDHCTPAESGSTYSSYGASIPGATYKFTTLDTAGNRVPAQFPQLAQTAYRALQAPYAFLGLGRTNNYIENLFVGTTCHTTDHFTNLEGVIPNSHIVINPPLPPSVNGSSSVRAWSEDWETTLYLQPGKWIQWVVATTVGIVGVLAVVTYVLHMKEKREDEAERRKVMHRINFAAFG